MVDLNATRLTKKVDEMQFGCNVSFSNIVYQVYSFNMDKLQEGCRDDSLNKAGR